MNTTNHARLFAPLQLGGLTLRNRIAVLPYGTAMVVDGMPREGDIAHYARLARSGPGLIITGAAVVHPSSATRSRILTEAYREDGIPHLREKAQALRAHGSAVFGQLIHLGREWAVGESDYAPMAPSSVRSPRDAYAPREMTLSDIATVIDAFGRAARNYQLAGFDGVELHAAHGYLLAQFLSPATNRRTDAYGGALQRRVRLLLEVIDSVRRHCDERFALSVRLSADEELADGLEVPHTVQIARFLQEHGGVDLLDVTLGTRGAYVKDMTVPDATAANAARAVRSGWSGPLLLGQRISTPQIAAELLEQGVADLIGMARAFFADPDWIPKAAAGQESRIRPCLNFNQDCRAFAPHLHCAVNPVTGRETDALFAELRPAPRPKRVAVIGGGPAGLEAALIAAARGHVVELFEASGSCGGQFAYAASVPHRDRLQRLLDWQLSELRVNRVPLHLGRRVEGIDDLGGEFDVAIVATGAVPNELPEALRAAGVVRWLDILEGGAPEPPPGGHAVYVDDGTGFWWNYGIAEALVHAGWRLTYVTPGASIGQLIPHESVAGLLARLGRGPTEFKVLTALDGASDGAARLVNVTSGDEYDLDCDLVVVHTGRRSLPGPAEALRAGGLAEVHVIGDAVTPRRVSFATFEAQRLARQI